ncbi:hypothetical protein GCM10028808_60130 [Spirosoma migulaei]
METIYDWLLHNIGNEGNYLTILNVQRQLANNELDGLDVMARTKDFKVINLFIQPTIKQDSVSDEGKGRTPKEDYFFGEPGQVITYLSEGKTIDLTADSASAHIHIGILEPVSNAGSVSFPPR